MSSDFAETSHLVMGKRMDGFGHSMAALSGTTASLMGENKSLTIMVCILMVIVVILLVIMYKVYRYTAKVEDLAYGRNRRFKRGRRRENRYESDTEDDESDYEW